MTTNRAGFELVYLRDVATRGALDYVDQVPRIQAFDDIAGRRIDKGFLQSIKEDAVEFLNVMLLHFLGSTGPRWDEIGRGFAFKQYPATGCDVASNSLKTAVSYRSQPNDSVSGLSSTAATSSASSRANTFWRRDESARPRD